MGIKEFQESFRKKYRNSDLYMLFDKKDGNTIEERIRKNKKYFCIVIKNHEGNKIKVIDGGKILDIEKTNFESMVYGYEMVRAWGKTYCLVPLEKLTIRNRDDKIQFKFSGEGDSIPGYLNVFCDVGCLCHKYVSDGSLANGVLSRDEKFKVLSERQIVAVEKFLNQAIHDRLKEKLHYEKEQKNKDEKFQKEKLRKQTLEEKLDKERDF